MKQELYIQGQNITEFYTLKSMYDSDAIGAIDDDGNHYRIKVEELYKIVNELQFTKRLKRTQIYLEIV